MRSRTVAKSMRCVVCLVRRIDGVLLCKECRADSSRHVRTMSDGIEDPCDLVIWTARRVRAIERKV